jgi:hypothetical protein
LASATRASLARSQVGALPYRSRDQFVDLAVERYWHRHGLEARHFHRLLGGNADRGGQTGLRVVHHQLGVGDVVLRLRDALPGEQQRGLGGEA